MSLHVCPFIYTSGPQPFCTTSGPVSWKMGDGEQEPELRRVSLTPLWNGGGAEVGLCQVLLVDGGGGAGETGGGA